MFQAIVRFAVTKKLFVGLTTLFLLAGGIYAMLTLPVDAVPDITNNQVQIVTVSPTLAPQEVEQLITFPIEVAMSNIMNVEEIRSVSRFGLSVVTVVFKESVPILDARQLINEQIQTVAGEIPPELGTPEMMPITTGLGEIYQYTLDVAPGYEDRYDPMELRTIQDWIVKRQLSGIPGIVEINSFGGYLKQYEVALYSLNITIGDVFEALNRNNQNTGGSYIEKVDRAYYIRSEGMISSLKDIERIVVANRGGIPVHIDDVGTVKFGSAKRFGAMTRDGKGECVGGIAMMLKGANANVVTKELESRVEKIQKMLPEGVSIVCGLAIGYPREMPDLKPKLPQPAVIHTNHYSADEELKPLLAEYDERITEYNRTRSGDQTTNDWSGHIADYHRHSMEHGIAGYLREQIGLKSE